MLFCEFYGNNSRFFSQNRQKTLPFSGISKGNNEYEGPDFPLLTDTLKTGKKQSELRIYCAKNCRSVHLCAKIGVGSTSGESFESLSPNIGSLVPTK